MSDPGRCRAIDRVAHTRGSIDRVANRVFLLTPPDYLVVNADSRRGGDGFFNQN